MILSILNKRQTDGVQSEVAPQPGDQPFAPEPEQNLDAQQQRVEDPQFKDRVMFISKQNRSWGKRIDEWRKKGMPAVAENDAVILFADEQAKAEYEQIAAEDSIKARQIVKGYTQDIREVNPETAQAVQTIDAEGRVIEEEVVDPDKVGQATQNQGERAAEGDQPRVVPVQQAMAERQQQVEAEKTQEPSGGTTVDNPLTAEEAVAISSRIRLIDRQELMVEGDNLSSPWLLQDGSVVGTGGDHIELSEHFSDQDDGFYSGGWRRGAVRAMFIPANDDLSEPGIFLHAPKNYNFSPDQVSLLREFSEKHDAPIAFLQGDKDSVISEGLTADQLPVKAAQRVEAEGYVPEPKLLGVKINGVEQGYPTHKGAQARVNGLRRMGQDYTVIEKEDGFWLKPEQAVDKVSAPDNKSKGKEQASEPERMERSDLGADTQLRGGRIEGSGSRGEAKGNVGGAVPAGASSTGTGESAGDRRSGERRGPVLGRLVFAPNGKPWAFLGGARMQASIYGKEENGSRQFDIVEVEGGYALKEKNNEQAGRSGTEVSGAEGEEAQATDAAVEQVQEGAGRDQGAQGKDDTGRTSGVKEKGAGSRRRISGEYFQELSTRVTETDADVLVEHYNSINEDILSVAHERFITPLDSSASDSEGFRETVDLLWDLTIHKGFSQDQATAVALDAFERYVESRRDETQTPLNEISDDNLKNQDTAVNEVSGEVEETATYQEGIQVVDPTEQQQETFAGAIERFGSTGYINDAKAHIEQLALLFPNHQAKVKKTGNSYSLEPVEYQGHPKLSGYRTWKDKGQMEMVLSLLADQNPNSFYEPNFHEESGLYFLTEFKKPEQLASEPYLEQAPKNIPSRDPALIARAGIARAIEQARVIDRTINAKKNKGWTPKRRMEERKKVASFRYFDRNTGEPKTLEMRLADIASFGLALSHDSNTAFKLDHYFHSYLTGLMRTIEQGFIPDRDAYADDRVFFVEGSKESGKVWTIGEYKEWSEGIRGKKYQRRMQVLKALQDRLARALEKRDALNTSKALVTFANARPDLTELPAYPVYKKQMASLNKRLAGVDKQLAELGGGDPEKDKYIPLKNRQELKKLSDQRHEAGRQFIRLYEALSDKVYSVDVASNPEKATTKQQAIKRYKQRQAETSADLERLHQASKALGEQTPLNDKQQKRKAWLVEMRQMLLEQKDIVSGKLQASYFKQKVIPEGLRDEIENNNRLVKTLGDAVDRNRNILSPSFLAENRDRDLMGDPELANYTQDYYQGDMGYLGAEKPENQRPEMAHGESPDTVNKVRTHDEVTNESLLKGKEKPEYAGKDKLKTDTSDLQLKEGDVLAPDSAAALKSKGIETPVGYDSLFDGPKKPKPARIIEARGDVTKDEKDFIKNVFHALGAKHGVGVVSRSWYNKRHASLPPHNKLTENHKGLGYHIPFEGWSVIVLQDLSAKRKTNRANRMFILAHELAHALEQRIFDNLTDNQKSILAEAFKQYKEKGGSLTKREWLADKVGAHLYDKVSKKGSFDKTDTVARNIAARLRTFYRAAADFIKHRFGLDKGVSQVMDELIESGAFRGLIENRGKAEPVAFELDESGKEVLRPTLAKMRGLVFAIKKQISKAGVAWKVSTFLRTSDSQLRDLDEDYADAWHLAPGSKKTLMNRFTGKELNGGFHFRVLSARGRLWSEFMDTAIGSKALKDYYHKPKGIFSIHEQVKPEKQQEVMRAIKELNDGGPYTTDFAKLVRKALDTLHAGYLKHAMPTMGYLKNYFPVIMNTMELTGKRDLTKQIMVKYKAEEWTKQHVKRLEDQGVEIGEDEYQHIQSNMLVKAEATADEVIDNILNGGGSYELAVLMDQSVLGPGFVHNRARDWFNDPKMVEELNKHNLMETDFAKMMFNYVASSVKRAEFERGFGGYTRIKGATEPTAARQWVRNETNKKDLTPEDVQKIESKLREVEIGAESIEKAYAWNIMGGEPRDLKSHLKRYQNFMGMEEGTEAFQRTRDQIYMYEQAMTGDQYEKWAELKDMVKQFGGDYHKPMLDELKNYGYLTEGKDGSLSYYSPAAGYQTAFAGYLQGQAGGRA